MKTPRDVSGKEMIKALKVFGYEFVRQNGSHIMVTTTKKGEHHLAVPNHNPLKTGTLNGIISQVAHILILLKRAFCRNSLYKPVSLFSTNFQKLKNVSNKIAFVICWL